MQVAGDLYIDGGRVHSCAFQLVSRPLASLHMTGVSSATYVFRAILTEVEGPTSTYSRIPIVNLNIWTRYMENWRSGSAVPVALGHIRAAKYMIVW